MVLFYNKNNSWEIVNPNLITLLNSIISSEKGKRKYLNLKQIARMVYTLNNSLVIWQDDDFIKFISTFDENLGKLYKTINSNQKGTFVSISRNNVESLKNDLQFLHKLFVQILSSMIIDHKRRLFFKYDLGGKNDV